MMANITQTDETTFTVQGENNSHASITYDRTKHWLRFESECDGTKDTITVENMSDIEKLFDWIEAVKADFAKAHPH
jgi:hypothetical protein